MTSAFEAALVVLRRGGVVAAATETQFGLLADALDAGAVERVFALKPRTDKAMPLILPSREGWDLVARDVPPLARALAEAFWPGPLTLAVPAREGVDARLVEAGRVAARWPAASPAQRLAACLGRPLTASSANRPGAPAATDAAGVRQAFGAEVAAGRLFVLDEPAPGGPPSTVVAVRGDAFEIVREGAVAAERIVKVAESFLAMR